MLKFFRKIRKSFIDSGNFKRYVLYAGGEVLLVVLGILIALQINNQNENRKQGKEEYKVLARMLDELDQNIERVTFLDTVPRGGRTDFSVKEAVEVFDSMKILIEDGLAPSELDYICSGPIESFFNLNLSNDAFEEMKNRGLFYSLKSTDLAKSIQAYYKKIERETVYFDFRHEKILKERESIRYGFLKFREDYARLGLEAVKKHPWILDPDSKHFYDLRLYVDQSGYNLQRNRKTLYAIVDASQQLKKAISDYLQDRR